MNSLINEKLIREAAQHDDWYLRIQDHYNDLQEISKRDEKLKEEIKEGVRSLFEDMVVRGELVLGGSLPELDEERKPIDTVVIHHTSREPGLRLARLNVIQLLNIYMPYYQNPTQGSEKHLKGKAIASNHFYNGEPVFWGYHWLIRMDGQCERILPDSALGWHAGNWDINCRSVGICLDNDYEYIDPDKEVLQTLGRLIAKEYPQVSAERILGHKEVRDTICPGGNFREWKQFIEL